MAIDNFFPVYVEVSNAAPVSYDWRNYIIVGPVKEQDSCSPYWTFSKAANLEGLYDAKKGTIETFSYKC